MADNEYELDKLRCFDKTILNVSITRQRGDEEHRQTVEEEKLPRHFRQLNIDDSLSGQASQEIYCIKQVTKSKKKSDIIKLIKNELSIQIKQTHEGGQTADDSSNMDVAKCIGFKGKGDWFIFHFKFECKHCIYNVKNRNYWYGK